MNNFIEMSFDEADEKFHFMVNNYDENASFDGLMFETYGDEIEYVKSMPPNRIWMYGDGDDGGTYIWSGWHFVNRLGYFISELPFPDNTDIQIKISGSYYFCEECHAEYEDDSADLMKDTLGEIYKCTACATPEEIKEYQVETV